jgi:VWFA-related protein
MTFRPLLISAAGALLAAQTPTFRVATRLIQVNVIVTDHKGEPVTGLMKDQFSIFDQGRPQKIVSLTEQHFEPRAAPRAPQGGGRLFSNRPVETQEAGVTVVLFDGLNTKFEDLEFARSRLVKFLRGIRPDDRVALYGLSSKLFIIHDFTEDASALLRALDQYRPGTSMETRATSFAPSNMGSGPLAPLDLLWNDMNQRTANNYMQSRVQITAAAMEAIARHLAGISARKNLVWVSGSFPASVGYFQKMMIGARPVRQGFQDEIESASRALSDAAIAIYPVDAHALTTLSEFNAATGQRINAGTLVKQGLSGDLAPIPELETMQKMADATGGRISVNTNDIEGAVRRAIDDSRVTYTLGYYPDHDQWDGSFREIKVKISHAGVEVRSRRGYLAVADAAPAASAPLSIADLQASALDSGGLGLSMQIDPADPRQLKVHLRVDSSTIRFEQMEGRWNAALDVLWIQLAADGNVIASHGQTLNFRLTPELYATARRDGLKLSSTETIDEKAVQLRFAARDPATRAMGSLHIPLRGLIEP